MIAIREYAKEEQPKYRAEALGIESLSTTELIQLITSSTYMETARELYHKAGSLRDLQKMSTQELTTVENVEPAAAISLKAAMELGRRLTIETPEHRPSIRCPADAAHLVEGQIFNQDQEHFLVMTLNTKNHVLGIHTLYIGSANTIPIRVAEVMKVAIQKNAVAIIIAHNHPSGDPTPSREDIALTKNIVEAGKLMDIEVLDHIIVGQNRHVSLKDRGLGFS